MSTTVPAIIEFELLDENAQLNELVIALRILYESGLILAEPRELLRKPTSPSVVEMLVTFVDEAASERWPLDPIVQDEVMPLLLKVSTGAFLTTPLIPTDWQTSTCQCETWDALLLSGPPYSHVCPLLCCNCWGFVPHYRAPLFDDLELWGQANARVAQLWFDSTTLARWAGDQLANYHSTLNRKARKLVNQLRKATGVPVYYRIFIRPDGPVRNCPNCGAEGKPSGWSRDFLVCNKCKLAFR